MLRSTSHLHNGSLVCRIYVLDACEGLPTGSRECVLKAIHPTIFEVLAATRAAGAVRASEDKAWEVPLRDAKTAHISFCASKSAKAKKPPLIC